MRVILARRSDSAATLDGPPEVHAYRVADDHSSAAVWRAPCGDVVKPNEVEIVDGPTGNPCPRCLVLAALAADTPPIGGAELEAPPVGGQLREVPPADIVVESAADALVYAPSWREPIVHFAEPAAKRRPYEGGTVVVGLCGGIGWGPHEHAPDGWPMCVECIQIAGART